MDDAVIHLGEIYDVGSDVEFPEKFRNYVQKENLLCWEYCKYLVFQKEHEPADGVTSHYRRLADKVMLFFETKYFLPGKCLVQFWRAEEVKNVDNSDETRFRLTTRNQPFLLWDFSFDKPTCEGIYNYRMKTPDVIVSGNGEGGVIGRVFRKKRMELTPEVAYYSSKKEYPQRDMALSYNIKCSFAIPLSDSSGNVVGVIEFVSPWEFFPYYMDKFLSSFPYDLEKDLLCSAVSEIKDVMEVFCGNSNIVFAQTWMLCKSCNSLSTSRRCAEELSASFGGRTEEENSFLKVESYCILQKGEGVVGKAAESSHNLVYCEDVAKFCINEYPLAHFARKYDITTSFAINLQSNHTANQVYVLEFFLDSNYTKGKDFRETLVPIVDRMRQSFRIFKIASGGGELGDSLSIQVIDANFPDIFEMFEIDGLSSIDNHTTKMDLIDNGENVVNTNEGNDVTIPSSRKHNSFEICDDKREELSIGVIDAVFVQQAVHTKELAFGNVENMVTNTDERDVSIAAETSADEPERELPGGVTNVVHNAENGVGSSEECVINSSNLQQRRGGIDIRLDELMEVTSMKRKDAAHRLNVSLSTFKRACRDYDIPRWPPRKRNIDRHKFHSCNSDQIASMEEQGDTAPTVPKGSLVTIKAKYGDKFIKFQLSDSSGIDSFHHQVCKRLKLKCGDYTVNYQDEDNDWIIVACDDDLHDYISSSTLLGKNTLMMSIEHI